MSVHEQSRWRTINVGPGILVTAAFIGPGTVLTASRAGASFGLSLLWVIVFAVFATVVLQEMAARLGIVTGEGLAEGLRASLKSPTARQSAVGLVLAAILFGNCAYQTGNLVGAAAGLEVLTGLPVPLGAIFSAAIALFIVWVAPGKSLTMTLTVLVALMGAAFAVAAVGTGPSAQSLVSGLRPSIPAGSEWSIVALIGTTVVPYNLFLHASSAARHFSDVSDTNIALRKSLIDTLMAVSIGGAITAALLVTAAATFANQELSSAAQIARGLKPSLGAWAEQIFAAGLFAAGLTSSITAPIAAGYATAGCFGWQAELSNVRLRVTASVVIGIGLVFAIGFGTSPIQTVVVAQIANGLLLPIVAGFLLFALNRQELLGKSTNGWIANGLGGVVLAVTVMLAARQFYIVGKLLFASE